jgi:two-component system, chemotaxis family, chemotaxis protein CheY
MAKTVLIVDDVAFVRKTLNEIFTDAHYQVVAEAINGAQAVALYERFHPDIVTMDIVMPEMSGIDATRKIIKLDKEAKVIIISAMGQENLIMEAINVGAKDYMIKPFSAADVIKTVERVLGGEGTVAAGRPGSRENKVG